MDWWTLAAAALGAVAVLQLPCRETLARTLRVARRARTITSYYRDGLARVALVREGGEEHVLLMHASKLPRPQPIKMTMERA